MAGRSISRFAEEIDGILPGLLRAMFKGQTSALEQGKITIPQYVTLDLLRTHGLLKMKDIAVELNITFPAATGLINRLHRMGMVKRTYDKGDRRVIYIDITNKGRGTVEQVRTQRKKVIVDIFGQLTEEERNSYLKIIRKIKDIMHSK